MEYKSFFKDVKGNEGQKCHYSTRLDTYGCGCEHDCSYCYAKSLLDFRGLWHAKNPSVADVDKVRKKIQKLPKGSVIRLGGMTDCFAPVELRNRVTMEAITEMNKRGVHYLIVTKSDNVARPEYIKAMNKDLAHIQITVTCFDDNKYKDLAYEKAPLPSARIKAIETLQKEGFDVSLRLSPLIPEFVDFDRINAVECDKILVEFLRVNSFIKKWFSIDYAPYTLKQGNYRHLPLEVKRQYVSMIKGKTVTVCEDEDNAYAFWRDHFNPNRDDCCNLRR